MFALEDKMRKLESDLRQQRDNNAMLSMRMGSAETNIACTASAITALEARLPATPVEPAAEDLAWLADAAGVAPEPGSPLWVMLAAMSACVTPTSEGLMRAALTRAAAYPLLACPMPREAP